MYIVWRQGQNKAADWRQKQGTQCLSGSGETRGREPPRNIIRNLFSFIYISIPPRNYKMDENITQHYSRTITYMSI